MSRQRVSEASVNFFIFLRDKIMYLFAQTIVFVFLMLFMYAFGKFSYQASVMFGIVFVLCSVCPLLLEFRRKNRFYKNLLSAYDQLDRKNLIGELIGPPDFVEGEILYNLLAGTNKAFLDEINRYKRAQEDYRTYIELWIHEIKTPMASAMLTIENQGKDTQALLLEDLQHIEEYAMQALFYSRSNSVEKDYIIQEMELKELCYRAIRKNSRLLIDNSISVEADNITGTVFCDPKWMIYVLDQLISNSAKYAAPVNAKILFYSKDEPNETIRYLVDNGAGIRPEELSRVFDKGFTGTLGRIHERATGMGLFLSKKLCNKLGLSLEITSQGQGSGVTAAIHFPKGSLTNDVI